MSDECVLLNVTYTIECGRVPDLKVGVWSEIKDYTSRKK
jgi:hypothetical protein